MKNKLKYIINTPNKMETLQMEDNEQLNEVN